MSSHESFRAHLLKVLAQELITNLQEGSTEQMVPPSLKLRKTTTRPVSQPSRQFGWKDSAEKVGLWRERRCALSKPQIYCLTVCYIFLFQWLSFVEEMGEGTRTTSQRLK